MPDAAPWPRVNSGLACGSLLHWHQQGVGIFELIQAATGDLSGNVSLVPADLNSLGNVWAVTFGTNSIGGIRTATNPFTGQQFSGNAITNERLSIVGTVGTVLVGGIADGLASDVADLGPQILGDISGTVPNRIDEMGSFTASGSDIYHGPGVTRIGSDGVSVRVADNAARIDGVHDVVVHGVPYDESGAILSVDGMPTNANQVAEAVRANPDWNSQPIRLLTCYGGCGPAQELSNILDVPVQGSTAPVGVPQIPNSIPVVRQGGQWIDFFPQGGN